jgi:hypothetical protein
MPASTTAAPSGAHGAAEALTLLDALARAPAAAALVVGALERDEDRKALRLAHPQLRDAVGEATTKLAAHLRPAAPRPPTARRWPRLEDLTICALDLATMEALGSDTWASLRSLNLSSGYYTSPGLDAPVARALAAALRRMPTLRALGLRVRLPDEAARELFRASSANALPELRELTLDIPALAPAAVRALAASGWRLEELDLSWGDDLGAAGLAPVGAAPTFAIRRLCLAGIQLNAAALLTVAKAPWPLEELELSSSDFRAAAGGDAAIAALSRHARLR